MCVISYMPAGTIATTSHLTNSGLSNPDGFGWAVRAKDGIITGRTMDLEKAIDRFTDLRNRHMDGDATFHARITTHGDTVIDNNHPFRVGDERTVLFHNGMLPINLPKGETRSDTRIFAEDRLTHMGLEVLDNKKRRHGLEKWMRGSKMVIMTTRYDMRKQTYLLNEDAGLWEDGIWWSNTSYQTAPKWMQSAVAALSNTDYSDWWEENFNSRPYDEGVQCLNPDCGITWTSDSDAAEKGVCQSCWRCLDCGFENGECFCYTPSYKREPATRWAK